MAIGQNKSSQSFKFLTNFEYNKANVHAHLKGDYCEYANIKERFKKYRQPIKTF